MRGQPGHNTRPIATLIPGHENMDDLRSEHSVDSQATWVVQVLGLSFDMLQCIYPWIKPQRISQAHQWPT